MRFDDDLVSPPFYILFKVCVCVQSGVAIPVSVVDVELVNLIFETRVCVSLDR